MRHRMLIQLEVGPPGACNVCTPEPRVTVAADNGRPPRVAPAPTLLPAVVKIAAPYWASRNDLRSTKCDVRRGPRAFLRCLFTTGLKALVFSDGPNCSASPWNKLTEGK
ncbi:hypothetical protein NL676_024398 [Syzygium grande]|nr:hypothetical protein NL676_024398 [Syzygium grande]